MKREINLGTMMTIGEVAEIMHVNTNTLRRWANQGILPSYRLGSRGDRRFMLEDVARFIDELNSKNKKVNFPTRQNMAKPDEGQDEIKIR